MDEGIQRHLVHWCVGPRAFPEDIVPFPVVGDQVDLLFTLGGGISPPPPADLGDEELGCIEYVLLCDGLKTSS